MGLILVSASPEQVIAEMEIGAHHLQPFGAVHGGVLCGLIESAASRGALEVTRSRGQPPPAGLENHTSFIRSARAGRVRVTAIPLTRGRLSQVWEANVRDDGGRLLASGRVRLIAIPSDTAPQD